MADAHASARLMPAFGTHDCSPPCAGKREKITITNDKGRLSQEEIDRMVREAEEFAEEDKKVKEKIDARNGLETYCYNMRSTIDDKLGDKLSEDDKATVSAAQCAAS